jgi:hypothetical protein
MTPALAFPHFLPQYAWKRGGGVASLAYDQLGTLRKEAREIKFGAGVVVAVADTADFFDPCVIGVI